MDSAPQIAADRGIRLHSVTVRYGRRVALEDVTGTFAAGSLTAVIGANGAGKSTLLAAIAGTVRLASGSIDRDCSQPLAYLPQVASIDTGYPLSLRELITLGAWRELGPFWPADGELKARVALAAAQVGLGRGLDRRIGEISAGELQRALFARVVLQEARIILLDEPFAAVDAPTQAALTAQLERWQREGRTVICVLHDLGLVRARFPAALVLASRVVAWCPTEQALAVAA